MDAKNMEASFGGLRRRLIRSHLVIAGIGASILIGTIGFASNEQKSTQLLTDLYAPTMKSLVQAKGGLDASLTGLRGWVVLGDQQFKIDRIRAWNEELEPAISDLHAFSRNWTSPKQVETFNKLRHLLKQLKDAQWWVADAAQTEGNEPARILLLRDVAPLANAIDASVAMIIANANDAQFEPGTGEVSRNRLLAKMLDFRLLFHECRSALDRCVDQAMSIDIETFERDLDKAKKRVVELDALHGFWTLEQERLYIAIKEDMAAFEIQSQQALLLRQQDDWNVAMFRMKTDATPKARQADQLLGIIHDRQLDLMERQLDLVSRHSKTRIFVSLILIALMALAAISFSIHSANRIALPIIVLARATRDLAAGRRQNDIPVTSDDELGYLTESFNSMRNTVMESETVLRQQAEELQRAESLMRGVLDTAADAIITIDERGDIESFNPSAEMLFGYSAEEAVKRNVNFLMPNPYAAEHDGYLRNYLTTGEKKIIGIGREVIGLRKDGSQFPLELAVSEVRQGKRRLFTGIIRDITDRKHVESSLQDAREVAETANRTKSDFLANMSHEIRTPMNGVIGMTQLVLDTELSADQRDCIETIQSSADALLCVINDILDFSKVEAGKLELDEVPVSLRKTVGDALKLLSIRAHEKDIELNSFVPPKLVDEVITDPTRLRQILTNLVGNAIKFTDEGEVTVDVSLETETEEELQLRFCIQDSGIGIPDDRIDKIFEAFSQADTSTTRTYGGTGLGLSISSQLVEMMGGRIWVESEPGKGSKFQFTVAMHKGRVSRQVVPIPNARVLIVDDNVTNLSILKRVFEGWGMSPIPVDNGTAAIEALITAANRGRPIDLMVTDGQMPEMDGLMLVKNVRNNKMIAETPVIFLSSAAMPNLAEQCDALKISARISKPAQQLDLQRAVLNALLPTKSPQTERQSDTALPIDKHEIPPAQKPAEPLSLLVVEDNGINQKVITRLLKKMGHTICVVDNGSKALDAIEQEMFDAILMDVQMPVMDGLTATTIIRDREGQSGNHIPIIAMTANVMDGDREKCLAVGMDNYIRKPIESKELASALGDVPKRHDEPQAEVHSLPMYLTGGRPVFDQQAALELAEQNTEFLHELAHDFLDDSETMITEMRDAVRGMDAATLQRTAHTLKSVTDNFSAHAAANSASRLEQLAVNGQIDGAHEVLIELEKDIRQLQAALRHYVTESCS